MVKCVSRTVTSDYRTKKKKKKYNMEAGKKKTISKIFLY